jgi:hypothetical protein
MEQRMAEAWEDEGRLEKGIGPYVHWWQAYRTERSEDGLKILQADLTPDAIRRRSVVAKENGSALQQEVYAGGAALPLPEISVNKSETGYTPWETDPPDLPRLHQKTVIVGIVDTGIALGHRRFRMRDGSTRFIAAWQQGAKFNETQEQLPCGEELYSRRINELLATHSGGSLKGVLDEDNFNRDARLVDPVSTIGQRDLDHPAAHGTHVLDLAAGFDPEATDEETLDRCRIIAVNLPAQYYHGSAGGFLAYYAVFAVDRILFLAQAAWRANNPGKPGGYPVVINFSYGMQAGPKDGSHDFERYLKEIVESRTKDWPAPVRIAMPVGNDNLARAAASTVMGAEGTKRSERGYAAKPSVTLPWRILPDDATPNFLEIWTEAVDPGVLPEVLSNLKLSATPPDEAAELAVGDLRAGGKKILGEFARVYCEVFSGADGRVRVRVLVALCPTAPLGGKPATLAPAGLWRVRLDYAGPPVDVAFLIQSDQSGVRYSKAGKRSYFDHPRYRVFGEDGALADTYSFEVGKAPIDNDNWMDRGPVQRKGSHNALASVEMDGFVCIGSYTADTGLPAVYSSTADGDWSKKVGRETLSASYPSEDAPSLFGLLAAGAKDGSVAAFRGTSMATGLATRDIATALTGWDGSPGSKIGTENWLRERAEHKETAVEAAGVPNRWGSARPWPKFYKLKVGVGRLAAPGPSTRVSRLGEI